MSQSCVDARADFQIHDLLAETGKEQSNGEKYAYNLTTVEKFFHVAGILTLTLRLMRNMTGKRVNYGDLAMQLAGVVYRCRRPAPLRFIVDRQQAVGVLYQIPVAFQHTPIVVLAVDIVSQVRLLDNQPIPFPR